MFGKRKTLGEPSIKTTQLLIPLTIQPLIITFAV